MLEPKRKRTPCVPPEACRQAVPYARRSLLAGIDVSRNLGEARAGALVQAGQRWEFGDARLFWDSIDKVESQAGFILGAELDFHASVGPLVGAGYRYRDGGDWVKHVLLARGGVAVKQLTAVASFDLTTENKVKTLELCWRPRIKRLILEQRLAGVRYDGGKTGMYSSFSLGWAF